jgi:hypothetical protein
VLRDLFYVRDDSVRLLILILLQKTEKEVKVKRNFDGFVQKFDKVDLSLRPCSENGIGVAKSSVVCLTKCAVNRCKEHDNVEHSFPVTVLAYNNQSQVIDLTLFASGFSVIFLFLKLGESHLELFVV